MRNYYILAAIQRIYAEVVPLEQCFSTQTVPRPVFLLNIFSRPTIDQLSVNSAIQSGKKQSPRPVLNLLRSASGSRPVG